MEHQLSIPNLSHRLILDNGNIFYNMQLCYHIFSRCFTSSFNQLHMAGTDVDIGVRLMGDKRFYRKKHFTRHDIDWG